jgi:hypothetical protein
MKCERCGNMEKTVMEFQLYTVGGQNQVLCDSCAMKTGFCPICGYESFVEGICIVCRFDQTKSLPSINERI